jgi:type II secretory ATPase GspE/PulE/Tfp pilus assembly ATPase PilB-like protein
MAQDPRADEERNIKQRAALLALRYYDTSAIKDKKIYEGIISNDDMYKLRIAPVFYDEFHITFGITNTTVQSALKQLTDHFRDQKVTFVLISDTGFKEYMKLYDPAATVVYHDIEITEGASVENVQAVSLTLEQVKADDMLAYLVQQAHHLNASDIHVETNPENVRIRFRIDGVLHPVAHLDIDKYRVLISAIASAGNISTAADVAQQGHIYEKVTMADGKIVDVNIRLETTPTINGMDVVMRLFNLDESMFTLDRLGLSTSERAVVDDIIKKPTGLVLIVGPTGSGKTTTLYSILNSLSSDQRKIITIEDPVEYQFPGITQISVTSVTSQETNFAERLRAVLRLDPDIVMVGEIRDMDTARTALQASLTGHLVLSTFHASNAAAALTRLLEIIGQNSLFLSSIRLVMAQRLVRRLDDAVKIPYKPDEATLKRIEMVINGLPDGIPKPDISNLQLYNPGSTPESPYGFKGQLAIREQFLMQGEMFKLLQNQTASSTEEIEKAAIASGMMTMEQDAMLKLIAGQTTLTEITRVIG